jgi:hypothetical protein
MVSYAIPLCLVSLSHSGQHLLCRLDILYSASPLHFRGGKIPGKKGPFKSAWTNLPGLQKQSTDDHTVENKIRISRYFFNRVLAIMSIEMLHEAETRFLVPYSNKKGPYRNTVPSSIACHIKTIR